MNLGGKRSGGPENDPMTHRPERLAISMLLAARRQNGIGEDSSRQDMEKKNMRWERIEDAEGMRSPRGFEPRSLDSVQSANRYTTGPADGSDRTRDLSLGSAGRDQVLQLTVSGA